MRQPIIASLICALMLIASTEALSSERSDKHRYKAKSEHREHRSNKRHYKKHRRQHHQSQHSHHRNKKHRRNNDAAIFIGGALLGAALTSQHNHRDNDSHSYSYQRDRRGDCFRVEYRRGKEIWFAVPRRQCQVY